MEAPKFKFRIQINNLIICSFLTQLHNFDSRKQQIIINQQLTAPSPVISQLNKQRTLDQQPQINDQITTEFVPWCCKYFLKRFTNYEILTNLFPLFENVSNSLFLNTEFQLTLT